MLLFLLLSPTAKVCAEKPPEIDPELLTSQWPAKWITFPERPAQEFGVYLFRRTFVTNSNVKHFVVHVSADNRYKLYVNGKYICNGPCRGDFVKWRFETVDIAPYLKLGTNVICAIVWNFASMRPVAQFSYRTGFILQGNTSQDSVVNTGRNWRVLKDTAYSPIPVDINQYYVVGPGEEFVGRYHPWDWMNPEYADSTWPNAEETTPGTPLKSIGKYGSPPPYILTPRELPMMEETLQRFASIRRSAMSDIPGHFLDGEESLTIPAHLKVKILFDQDRLTNAYPVLTIDGGDSATIRLTYAESLFDDKGQKGNRNNIEGKEVIGNHDMIVSDGGTHRTFQTLWWRTFRYLEMEIVTRNEPLIISDFHSVFTGYPFQEKASFKCDDTVLTEIWNAGWRTQRLCAGETFFDCPYYEQLQYAGDTRIQCLISTYVSGDTALMRNAVSSLDDSRLPFGLTQSRYPSYQTQIIPPFSLIWVTMVHDYWMLCGDDELVKTMIPGIIGVLQWYESKIDSTGMLGRMEWWNFVDWVRATGWNAGTPPGIYGSNSAIVTLQYVYTLQKASAILKAFNMADESARYADLADKIKLAVLHHCYDRNKGLFADSPMKNTFSQHVNIMAVLTDAIPRAVQKDIMEKMIDNKDVARCSYYYRFYLTEAMGHAGLASRFPDMLVPWEEMLNEGLTTFAEQPDPTRSDCHAWSASPIYYFLSLICGIRPNEPGFKSARIEPHLGRLKWIEGSMPHRLGMIELSLKRVGQGDLKGQVVLPRDLRGIFVWHGHTIALNSGTNVIRLNSN
jgi:hypothetical protein